MVTQETMTMPLTLWRGASFASSVVCPSCSFPDLAAEPLSMLIAFTHPSCSGGIPEYRSIASVMVQVNLLARLPHLMRRGQLCAREFRGLSVFVRCPA